MNDLPQDVGELKEEIARDFPRMLNENLVGIYLWGSLTYDAFDVDKMPARWKATIADAIENRLRPDGRSNSELWNAANDFINFVGQTLGTHASIVPPGR